MTIEQNEEYIAKCFNDIETSGGNLVFEDSGKADWESKWFLDGEIAGVENTPFGLRFEAGPRFANNAHHAVLWTQQSFEGDIKIDYTFTRTDFAQRCVNILYIQATGPSEGEDIATWSDKRTVPSMQTYFNGMHTYHISYAAFENNFDDDVQYIRARRYIPGSGTLEGTALPGDYEATQFFKPGVPHQISVIKRQGRELLMRVSNAEATAHYRWYNEELPAIEAGRIGLRQMCTRSAIYSNFRVSML